jgi:ProP effector
MTDAIPLPFDLPSVHRDGLHWYCGSPRYLIVLQEGAVRIGLDGEPVGTVTAEEAAHAQQRLTERLKPKPSPATPEKAAKPEQRPKPPPKTPPKAPPKAKADVQHEPPSRKGRDAGKKAVVVEVRRKFGAGPKRTFNV